MKQIFVNRRFFILSSLCWAITTLATSTIFAEIGLVPKVERVQPSAWAEKDVADRYYLKVSFGRLDIAQFQKLKTKYGNFSKVNYDPLREYSLVDFLPPAMQALADQTFLPKQFETEPLRDIEVSENDQYLQYALTKNGLSSFTNCWGTTMEILRSIHPGYDGTFTLYWPGRFEAGDLLEDSRYSRKLSENEDLRFGDIVAFREKSLHDDEYSSLQHTAIYLGDGLVFEKVDGGKTDPYRISYLKDIENKYASIFAERLIIQRRRSLGENLQIFPTRMAQQMSDEEKIRGKIAEVLKRHNPDLILDDIHFGCEQGLGGGCDPVYTVAHTMKLAQYAPTGRGILKGRKDTLNRFKPLPEGPKNLCEPLIRP